MKKLILVLICLGLFFLTFQGQVVEHNYGRKCAYKVQRLENGKLGISRREVRNAGRDGNFKQFGSHEQKKSGSGGAGTSKFAIVTHHITFHFDKSWNWVSLNGNDTAFWTMSNLYWTDNYSVYGDISDGYYYLYVELQQGYTIFYILQDAFYGWGYGTIFNDSVLGRHVDPFMVAFEDTHYPGTGSDIDLFVATYDIWKGGIHLFHGPVGQYEIAYSGQPDVYSLIVNDSNYTLLGKQGYTKSELTFDLRQSDPNPPTLTAFKVLMCDSLHSQLIHGYPASVEFTAGDFYQIPYVAIYYYPPASVSLKFKDYSDTSWFDLNAVPESSRFDLYCGMHWLEYRGRGGIRFFLLTRILFQIFCISSPVKIISRQRSIL